MESSLGSDSNGMALEETTSSRFRFVAYAENHQSEASNTDRLGTSNYKAKRGDEVSEEDKMRRTQVKQDIETQLAQCRYSKSYKTDPYRLQNLSCPKKNSHAVTSAEEMMAKAQKMAANRAEMHKKLEKEKQRQERVTAGLEIYRQKKEEQRKQEELEKMKEEEEKSRYKKELNEYLKAKAHSEIKELAARKKESIGATPGDKTGTTAL
jgi:hypothetical protein